MPPSTSPRRPRGHRRTPHPATVTALTAHRGRTNSPHPVRRRRRAGRVATVWPCARDSRRDGLTLAGWLLDAIIRLVGRHTQRGDRVLLMTAPETMSTSLPGPSRHGGLGRDLSGLEEAAWAVSRLHRQVDTWTSSPASPGGWATEVYTEPDDTDQSESGPRPFDPDRAPTRARPAETGARPATATDRPEFDLIITSVEPDAIDWVRTAPWRTMLARRRTVAVITHSHSEHGRLVDPGPLLVDTFSHHGLGWLDRIVLLTTPTLHPPAIPASSSWSPLRHAPVHADALLFVDQPPAAHGKAPIG